MFDNPNNADGTPPFSIVFGAHSEPERVKQELQKADGLRAKEILAAVGRAFAANPGSDRIPLWKNYLGTSMDELPPVAREAVADFLANEASLQSRFSAPYIEKFFRGSAGLATHPEHAPYRPPQTARVETGFKDGKAPPVRPGAWEVIKLT